MIFTLGLLLAAVGWMVGRTFGHPIISLYNNADHFAVTAILIGAAMVGYSLLSLAWRYLP